MLALWIAGFSACAYAQDRSVSQRSQVVLIARLPDTFAVNSQDAASLTGTQQRGPSAEVTLRAVGHLTTGTSATTACFVRTVGSITSSAVSRTRSLSSVRSVSSSAAGGGPACDGIFRILKGPADLIAIETQDPTSTDRRTPGRLDVIFSIL